MSKLLNIQGAPGTGKTRMLLAQYIRACELVGPERVCAVTFTRAAADELRERCAQALGLNGAPWVLRRQLPWVGTIHALCLKLSDLPNKQLVDSAKLKDFDKRIGDGFRLPNIEHMDSWAYDEPTRKSEDVEVALYCRAAAQHRMVDLADVWPLLDPDVANRMSLPRIRRIVEDYEKWKHERKLIDFEDLLLLGRTMQPPVRVVLADECQDNSPLLWSVVNAWGGSEGVASFICAGDAYQALYSFAGGDPRLFSDRAGDWHVIRESHRFNNQSAHYARRILGPVFGRDERFGQLTDWEGVGGTGPSDPSRFWLARTNSLVAAKAARLQDAGAPYHLIRGRAPLQTLAADAYRSLLRIEQGKPISRDEIVALSNVKGLPGGKTREEFIRHLPTGYYGAGSVEAAFGVTVRALMAMLPWREYFTRLRQRHGDDAMFERPRLSLGTVHAAKGKEAGSVTVCTNWATKPAGNLATIDGRRSEACCAYVAASRHKHTLTFEDLWDVSGSPYPFPGRRD